MDKEAYKKRMREIRMFLGGNKKQLIRMLEKDMKEYAQEQEFEKAEEVRRRIFALQHIQDVSLLKKETDRSCCDHIPHRGIRCRTHGGHANRRGDGGGY